MQVPTLSVVSLLGRIAVLDLSCLFVFRFSCTVRLVFLRFVITSSGMEMPDGTTSSGMSMEIGFPKSRTMFNPHIRNS